MTATSYKLDSNLFLVSEKFSNSVPVTQSTDPINHIFLIDCSGSMYGDLPAVRLQLKNKLPTLLNENDTASIIWFSGRGQFGTLVEAKKVVGLESLQTINTAIDKWLRPTGLTGFKEPIDEVTALIGRTKATNPGSFSMVFMSDGQDNCWQHNDILKAVDKAAEGLSSATFVEYGFWADRPLLTRMAEQAGGQLVFSKNFDQYDIVFSQAVAGATRSKRVDRHLDKKADFIGGIAFALEGKDITTYKVDGGKVTASEATTSLFYLSPTPVGSVEAFEANQEAIQASYAAMSLWAVRMKPAIVKSVLKATGDVRFIKQFANCFGKQAYSDFMEATKEAAFDPAKRLVEGKDSSLVPREDAFTVLQLLALLADDEENKLMLNHEKFSYSKVSRARVDSNTVLTTEEQEEVAELTAKLSMTKNPKEVTKISARIAEISDKPDALKFEENREAGAAGYSISNLTFNEDRPNVSVLVQKHGTVSLASRKDRPDTVPEVINTKIFRNYTIIKDGLVNVEVLPVKITAETRAALTQMASVGLIPLDAVEQTNDVTLINLTKLPVINSAMVKDVSAKAVFTKAYNTLKTKAAQKVYNDLYSEKGPKVVAVAWKAAYGEDAVLWLKNQGLTEFNGFSPLSVQAEATDQYMAKELLIKMKGLSSLPPIKEVRAKVASGKALTASVQLLATPLKDAEAALAKEKDQVAWLEAKKKETTKKARELMFEMAIAKFTVIVGQTWFSEFSSLEENTLEMEMDGQKIHFTAELKETPVKI